MYPPNVRHFIQAADLRWRFLLEAAIASFHPLPTAIPLRVPQPGECRLGGLMGTATVMLSDDCLHVYSGYAGLLMFLRLYLLLRVVRDNSTIWRMRSLIKSAAVGQFAHFPDINIKQAVMYYLHKSPIRCWLTFILLVCSTSSFVLWAVEARQENCDADLLLADGTPLRGLVDPDSRCSHQVIRSYVEALWLVVCNIVNGVQGVQDIIPTSHVGRIVCFAVSGCSIVVDAGIIAMFSKAVNPNEYQLFAVDYLEHRAARKRLTRAAAVYVQRHFRGRKNIPQHRRHSGSLLAVGRLSRARSSFTTPQSPQQPNRSKPAHTTQAARPPLHGKNRRPSHVLRNLKTFIDGEGGKQSDVSATVELRYWEMRAKKELREASARSATQAREERRHRFSIVEALRNGHGAPRARGAPLQSGERRLRALERAVAAIAEQNAAIAEQSAAIARHLGCGTSTDTTAAPSDAHLHPCCDDIIIKPSACECDLLCSAPGRTITPADVATTTEMNDLSA